MEFSQFFIKEIKWCDTCKTASGVYIESFADYEHMKTKYIERCVGCNTRIQKV